MSKLQVRSDRSGTVETVHNVCVAVADKRGSIIAGVGDPALVIPSRSTAKPFQTLPLIEDGVAGEFAITERELALACASHNSESYQVAIARDWMSRVGVDERDLACGPHRSLAKDLGFRQPDGSWEDVELASPSRAASPCAGKHTGMLSLAKFHGWTMKGYTANDHPVQQRCRSVVSQWFDLPLDEVQGGVDGCGVVSWAVPVRALATGYARLADDDASMKRIVASMIQNPDLVAGKRRCCTALMETYPGRVLAKVGAGGVYGATLLDRGLGIAVKVLDGDPRAAAAALLAVLDHLGLDVGSEAALFRFAKPVVVNTNHEVVGHYEAVGSLTDVA